MHSKATMSIRISERFKKLDDVDVCMDVRTMLILYAKEFETWEM